MAHKKTNWYSRLSADKQQLIESIFDDFIHSLDEALETFEILKDRKKPSQLLFCHIVNNFDSFIANLYRERVLNDKKLITKLLEKKYKEASPFTIKKLLKINDKGLDKWIMDTAREYLDTESRPHHKKLIDLWASIEAPDRYVTLNTGLLKKNPAGEEARQTPQYKTNTEGIFGHADILYKKRNAITHNRNKHQNKVIQKLNKDYGINIQERSILIKSGSNKTAFRFYADLALEIANTLDVSVVIKDDLSALRSLEAVDRRVNELVDARWQNFLQKGLVEFCFSDYTSIAPDREASTHRRDIGKLVARGVIKKKKKVGAKWIYEVV